MLKARLKFKAPWDIVLVEVAKQCGMTVDEYCTKAVMLVTKEGLGTSTSQSELGVPSYGSRSQESQADNGQASPSTDDRSATLADKEDTSSTEV